jgi:CDP-glycerol glycerophosphotransferase (TagB/SpsB family)
VKTALFYVAYAYYYPHFLPISTELERRGVQVTYILSESENLELLKQIAQQHGLKFEVGRQQLFDLESDFIFFSNTFPEAQSLKGTTIFLEHGIGTKSSSFYAGIEVFDLYLVEGDFKYNRLRDLYPAYEGKLRKVGFTKYDTLLKITPEQKASFQKRYALDPLKKTILYAPTFFPSSIERLALDFPAEFADCNLLIKPHYLSYSRKSYRKQLKRLEHWATYENCRVADVSDFDLTPFLANADVMISDESSAMFEFAGLQKPVISNQFFKLRWSYYLMPWKLKQRIDVKKEAFRVLLHEAHSYEEMLKKTHSVLDCETPKQEHQKLLDQLCGVVDGQVSARITDLLLEVAF